MDDARIQQLRQQVLSRLHSGTASEERTSGDLEDRVAALERTVAVLAAGGAIGMARGARGGGLHPALQVLSFPGEAPDRCVMEPDKPCVKSHACRTFGY